MVKAAALDNRNEIASVHGIYSYNIDDVWPVIKPMLERSLDYADGKFSAKSVRDALITKAMQLWVAVTKDEIIKAFAITQIVNYPNKCVLIIMFAGGESMQSWLRYINILQNFAAFHECEAVEIYGRNGWEKALAPYGYVKIHSVYRLATRTAKHEKDMDEISISVQQENP